MLKPLEQFICDECGHIITSSHEGYVEWEAGQDIEGACFARGFRIVHHLHSSPLGGREGCYKYGNSNYRHDMHLNNFLENAHQYMCSFLDLGLLHDPDCRIGCRIQDFREYSDFFRRLTIPYYEEARKYIPEALHDGCFDDANEIAFYTPELLRRIIEKYGEK